MSISRRGLLLGFSALLAGCATNGPNHVANYAAIPDEKFPVPAMPLDKIKPGTAPPAGGLCHES